MPAPVSTTSLLLFAKASASGATALSMLSFAGRSFIDSLYQEQKEGPVAGPLSPPGVLRTSYRSRPSEFDLDRLMTARADPSTMVANASVASTSMSGLVVSPVCGSTCAVGVDVGVGVPTSGDAWASGVLVGV